MIHKDNYTFDELLQVLKILRHPQTGCAWDRVQTHESIKQCLLNETAEFIEAIELDDTAKMIEEAGDVLLQPLFHAAIAEESGRFSAQDVINALVKKLIWRHTHIFGKDTAATPDEALDFWQKAKAAEKKMREQGLSFDKVSFEDLEKLT
jgi:tetrapyrrole methylase family protein/MazG family protein